MRILERAKAEVIDFFWYLIRAGAVCLAALLSIGAFLGLLQVGKLILTR